MCGTCVAIAVDAVDMTPVYAAAVGSAGVTALTRALRRIHDGPAEPSQETVETSAADAGSTLP
jgi:hypothetical protein